MNIEHEKVDLVLVDENASELSYLESLLNKYKIQVKSFTDPFLGLNEIIRLKPSIVVVSHHMEELNGDKFMIRISEMKLFQHSKFFFLTYLDAEKANAMGICTLGCDQLFSKPVDGVAFIKAIENVLGELEIK